MIKQIFIVITINIISFLLEYYTYDTLPNTNLYPHFLYFSICIYCNVNVGLNIKFGIDK